MQIDFHGQFLAVLPYVKKPNRPQRTVMMTDQEDDDDMHDDDDGDDDDADDADDDDYYYYYHYYYYYDFPPITGVSMIGDADKLADNFLIAKRGKPSGFTLSSAEWEELLEEQDEKLAERLVEWLNAGRSKLKSRSPTFKDMKMK